MRIGDAVRLKPDSPLRARLAPFADARGEVVDTYQDDDEELRITVAYADQFRGWLAPLSAEDFEIVPGRADDPF